MTFEQLGTQFTCVTGTKVQKLTQKTLLVLDTDENGDTKRYCFMYEKFSVTTKEASTGSTPATVSTEVSEMRLRLLNASLREAEIIKLKNETRINFTVKTELEFRQCWHWIEMEYRWGLLLSLLALLVQKYKY